MLSKLDSLARRIQELAAGAHQAETPTTTPDGKRAWIHDSGLSVIRLFNELLRSEGDDGSLSFDKLPEELSVQVDSWSRAELDENCGALASMVKQQCREIMGPRR